MCNFITQIIVFILNILVAVLLIPVCAICSVLVFVKIYTFILIKLFKNKPIDEGLEKINLILLQLKGELGKNE